MARSTYVYVVINVIGVTTIFGTWTVKREMVRTLKRLTENELVGLEAYRCGDAWRGNGPVKMDLEELLNG